MALSTLRLRRALSLSSHLLKHRPVSAIASSKPYISSSSPASSFSSSSNFRNPKNLLQVPTHSLVPSASFRSSALVLNSSRYNDDDDKISPDTILFEGCDYNHWLITMDFPKDPKPTPEEMVETYVQTCAKGLGISIEEAKQKMYACSTTTYQGFQAVMTEEESEKFRGLPGVVFILPDSYIDPVNKEYGGDKYINGTIIPRPPPVQYSRTSGRNRDNRPRYDRQQRDPMPMQQRTPPYDRQSSMPHQNFGPPGQSDGRGYSPPGGRDFSQGERRDPMPMGGRDERGPMPMQQMNTPFDHQSSPPQQSYGQYGQSDGRGYGPPGGRDFSQGERRDPTPMGGRGYTPGGYQGQSTYNQGDQRNYAPQERRDFRGDFREQGTVPSGDYRPAGSSGYSQSYPGTGDRQRVAGDYRQTGGSGYGQGYAGPGDGQRFGGDNRGSGYGGPSEGQRFSPVDHDNGIQSEQRNFNPVGQTGTDQGRY